MGIFRQLVFLVTTYHWECCKISSWTCCVGKLCRWGRISSWLLSCCQLGSIRRLYCWNLCNRFSKLLFLPWVLIDPWLPAPCLDWWWFKSFSRILASERENFRDSLNLHKWCGNKSYYARGESHPYVPKFQTDFTISLASSSRDIYDGLSVCLWSIGHLSFRQLFLNGTMVI